MESRPQKKIDPIAMMSAIAVDPEDLGFGQAQQLGETIADMNGNIMEAAYAVQHERRMVEFLEREVSDRFLQSREHGEVAARMLQEGCRRGARKTLISSTVLGVIGGATSLLLQCSPQLSFLSFATGTAIGLLASQTYVAKKEGRSPSSEEAEIPGAD